MLTLQARFGPKSTPMVLSFKANEKLAGPEQRRDVTLAQKAVFSSPRSDYNMKLLVCVGSASRTQQLVASSADILNAAQNYEANVP